MKRTSGVATPRYLIFAAPPSRRLLTLWAGQKTFKLSCSKSYKKLHGTPRPTRRLPGAHRHSGSKPSTCRLSVPPDNHLQTAVKTSRLASKPRSSVTWATISPQSLFSCSTTESASQTKRGTGPQSRKKWSTGSGSTPPSGRPV